jgi:hypothetical protein
MAPGRDPRQAHHTVAHLPARPRGTLPPVPICRRAGVWPTPGSPAIKNGRNDNASAANALGAFLPRKTGTCLARRDKSIAKGNRNGHPTGRARYSRAPQMAATARFDASFCHSPGLPLSWAGARSGSGCGPAAALLPIASPVAKAAHPGLWRRARRWCAGCAAKRGARSKRRIAAAANRVLCSRRLYIVQSEQR